MISYKRKITYLSRQYSIDHDVLIISLWSYKSNRFKYLNTINDVILQKDLKLTRKIIANIRSNNNNDFQYIKTQKQSKKSISKNYNFNVGHSYVNINYLDKEDVLKIHEELVNDFRNSNDPISPHGLKDERMLESALLHQETSFEEKLKYPTVESSAAALIYALSNNHPFYNGNKRTALVALLVFLDKHNYYLLCDEHDLFKLSLDIASHKILEGDLVCCDGEIYQIARWIHGNIKTIQKGEVPLTFNKLYQRLKYFNCSISDKGKITRLAEKQGVFGRTKTFISKIPAGKPPGHEADKPLIKKIREDLHLDAGHGYDSDMFYGQINHSIDEFIEKYRNVLNRLSKV